MAMEKILAQILSELQNLNTRLDGIDTRFDGMDARFDSMDARQSAMEQQLVAFQQFTLERFDRLEGKFDRLEGRVENLEEQQTKTNVILENEIRPAIKVLTEGQAMQQAQLDRIEKQITTHDEIIFKRVK